MIAQLKKLSPGHKAQALLEFALAIPIILVLVIGMFEVGRLIAYYSAVNSAAREAARYGAASGTVNGVPRYCDTAGIRDAAVKPGFIAGVQPTSANVIIQYDEGATGPGDAQRINISNEGQGPCAAGAKLKDGQRIYITVQVTYTPSVSFPSSNVLRTVKATAARTIMSEIYVPDALPADQQSDPSKLFPPTKTPTATSVGGGGGINCSGNKCTATPTPGGPTATATATATLGPSPTPVPPTNTPIVIIPTPIPVIPTCTLGHTDLLFTTATAPTWNLTNYYNAPVTVTKIEIFSNITGQAVTAISFGGTNIYSGSVGTPALIKSGWAGTFTNRELAAGTSKTMNLTLAKADMVGSLQIKVTFDIGGCTVLDSSLVQP